MISEENRNLSGLTMMNYISFSNNVTSFTVGTDSSYLIQSLSDFTEIYKSKDDFCGGGIGIIEKLEGSNIVALVGGGQQPAFSKNKVLFWDFKKKVEIGEINVQRDILKLKVFTDFCFICCFDNIYIFNTPRLSMTNTNNTSFSESIEKLSTYENPYGTMFVQLTPVGLLLAYPSDEKKGTVCVYNKKSKESLLVGAHEGEIRCICMKESVNGTLMATASDKGTLIRVFNLTSGGQLMKSFRRGSSDAWIYSIAFCHDASQLACTSSTGTVHLFDMSVTNSKFYDYFIPNMIEGEAHKAQYQQVEGFSCCCFAPNSQNNNILFVISSIGKLFKLDFSDSSNVKCQMLVKFFE